MVSIRDNIAYGRDGGFRHSRDFILTECYFQFTVQFFGGILWSRKLLVVFYEDRNLWMLHNQFSLESMTESALGVPLYSPA